MTNLEIEHSVTLQFPENMPIYRDFESGASRDRTGDLLLAKQALNLTESLRFAGRM
jgi:hypothetical protein